MESQSTLVATAADLALHRQRLYREGKRVALVPTMGALHDGHIALVRRAREVADAVVVSIFVNPTQFGPDEDFDRYPRSIEADLSVIGAAGGVDLVFAPGEGEMYPDGTDGQAIWISVGEMENVLCGRHRPGHFRGVATVVTKLLHLCRPDAAVFGLKDAQQFVILRRMIRDLAFNVELVGVQTQREPDGLAISSRNRYLNNRERKEAFVLSRAVSDADALILAGERSGREIERKMKHTLSGSSRAAVEYAEVVDADNLTPVDVIRPGQKVLSAVAVYFGATRLIDNAFTTAPG